MENTRRANNRRREMQKKRMNQKLAIVAVLALVIGLVLGWSIGRAGNDEDKEVSSTVEGENVNQNTDDESEGTQSEPEEPTPETLEEPEELPWNLVLVNPWNRMEEGYVPELVEVEDEKYVDSRIAEDTKKMMEDARAAGISAFICSAYRSVERQEQLFDNKIQRELDKGLGYYDAYVSGSAEVAVPGTSEHALGLAVDIISVEYTNLDEGQEDTEAFKWLSEHCYDYGFILRYPNGTTEITGIIYEPWHYRYVGKEVAAEIKELGVTFEEYLENHYNQ